MKLAVLGNMTVDFFAQDLRRDGHEVYLAPGFDTWRQEIRNPASGLSRYAPEAVLFVFEGQKERKDAAEEIRRYMPGVSVIAPELELLAGEVSDFRDERMRQLAAMPFSLAGVRAIEEEFRFLLDGSPKKVLALDADNTLWRGIVSEDGADAVVPFMEFQRGILALRERGVLLVLLSKNDPPVAGAPIAQAFARADMPLKLTDFTAVGVDWAPKPGHLLEICRQLNLATDSVVFIDDNPHEREQMRAHLPEVAVPPFPRELTQPAQFLRRLKMAYFPDTVVTSEDRARAAFYADERRRQALRTEMETVDEYLDGLRMICRPMLATAADVPRLAQMAGKTNQFNATTIRHTAEEFTALISDPRYRVWIFRLADRFGDMGVVCYVIADLAANRITDFVMSCRAMGRTVEHFALNHVRADFAAMGHELVGVDFTATAKNGPFADFHARIGDSQSLRTHVKLNGEEK